MEVAAVSAGLELSARLRLVLLDERGVVQAVSVARNWFGAYPEVAPLGLRPQGITTDPGVRLNFRGQAGQAYHLRVENYALAEDRVNLSATGFVPNPSGKGEASKGPLSSSGSLTATTFPGPGATCVLSTRALWTWWPSSTTVPTTSTRGLWTRCETAPPSPRPPSSWSGTGASPGRDLTRRGAAATPWSSPPRPALRRIMRAR